MIAPGDTIGVGGDVLAKAPSDTPPATGTFRMWGHGDSNGSLVGSYGVGFSGDGVFRNPGAIPGYAGQIELTRAFSVGGGSPAFLDPAIAHLAVRRIRRRSSTTTSRRA